MGYWARKALHIGPLFLVLALQAKGFTPRTGWPVSVSLALLFTLLDIRRLFFMSKAQQLAFIANDAVLEPREMNRMSASWYYNVGVMISMVINVDDIDSFLLGLGMLALCDPAASFFGVKYGGQLVSRRSWDGKSWEGNLAAACVGVIWSCWYLQSFTVETAVTAFVIASAVDLLPAVIDDNLVWPVVSSVLWSFALHRQMPPTFVMIYQRLIALVL